MGEGPALQPGGTVLPPSERGSDYFGWS